MPKTILADTGPLYAAADPSDQFHRRARAELDALAAQNCCIAATYTTLSEAHTLVLRRLGTRYAHQWLGEMLEGLMLVNPEPGDFLAAFGLLQEYSGQAITLFDAVAAAISVRYRFPVWTYDRHFELLGARLWEKGADSSPRFRRS